MLVIEGAAARRRYEHNERAWQAHTGAQLAVYAPAKANDFPPLDRLLAREVKVPPKPKDWKTVLAKVTAWVNGAQGK